MMRIHCSSNSLACSRIKFPSNDEGKHKLPIILLAALTVITSSAAHAQQACSQYKSGFDDIANKYKSQYDGFQGEGDKIKSETSAKFNVKWDNTEIFFKTPSVTIRDQKLIFGLPQVTMKDQHIIFDTPSVRMKNVKTGQYPEFTCDHAVIPHCETKWSDIITSVPETFMERQDIVLSVPEFKWDNVEIVMGIPEFFMQEQRIVIGLPQFTLTEAHINSEKIKSESDNLQSRISDTKSAQVNETSEKAKEMFSCYRSDLAIQRANAVRQFNEGIGTLNKTISDLRGKGIDPSKISDNTGKVTNLVEMLNMLTEKQSQALKSFDNAKDKLDQAEEETLAKLAAK